LIHSCGDAKQVTSFLVSANERPRTEYTQIARLAEGNGREGMKGTNASARGGKETGAPRTTRIAYSVRIGRNPVVSNGARRIRGRGAFICLRSTPYCCPVGRVSLFFIYSLPLDAGRLLVLARYAQNLRPTRAGRNSIARYFCQMWHRPTNENISQVAHAVDSC
jgi:hypothetical protein